MLKAVVCNILLLLIDLKYGGQLTLKAFSPPATAPYGLEQINRS